MTAEPLGHQAPAPGLPAGPTPPEPAILPFAPRRGWQQANLGRRLLAVTCPLLILLWVAIAQIQELPILGADGLAGTADDPVDTAAPGWVTPWNALYLLLGPVACSSLARVLRPYPNGPGGERRWRHWCAATATACGIALMIVIATDAPIGLSGDVGAAYLILASLLGPATGIWGISRSRRPS